MCSSVGHNVVHKFERFIELTKKKEMGKHFVVGADVQRLSVSRNISDPRVPTYFHPFDSFPMEAVLTVAVSVLSMMSNTPHKQKCA